MSLAPFWYEPIQILLRYGLRIATAVGVNVSFWRSRWSGVIRIRHHSIRRSCKLGGTRDDCLLDKNNCQAQNGSCGPGKNKLLHAPVDMHVRTQYSRTITYVCRMRINFTSSNVPHANQKSNSQSKCTEHVQTCTQQGGKGTLQKVWQCTNPYPRTSHKSSQ